MAEAESRWPKSVFPFCRSAFRIPRSAFRKLRLPGRLALPRLVPMVPAVAPDAPPAQGSAASGAGRSFYLETFRWMLLARTLEEKIASLYRAGKINGGVFLGTGQEALSASLGVSLRKGDFFGPLIRDMAGRLAFGEPVIDSMRTYLGSPLGPMRARDGNIHRGRPRDG